MTLFEQIALYFAYLATLGPAAVGFLPFGDPLAPPGPEGPRPAISISVCPEVPYAP